MRKPILLLAAIVWAAPLGSAQLIDGTSGHGATGSVAGVRTAPDFPKTWEVPGEKTTIQEAIDAAEDGDTVLVWPGNYFELIDFKGKAITVESRDGPGVTAIDGSTANSVVTFRMAEGPDSVLEGFTITNGQALETGGGVRCKNGASPTIRGNVITGNTTVSSAGGGGIGCIGASPLIAGNTISNNQGITGGGGILVVAGDPQILGNTLRENSTSGEGAGIESDATSNPVIRNNTISLNVVSGTGDGGGIHTLGPQPAIRDNVIDQNHAHEGGGVYLENAGSQARVTGNTFTGNTCQGTGGALACESSSATISGNTFTGNQANSGGGAISCQFSTTPITDNLIQGNSASKGGGIYLLGSNVLISGNDVLANHATGNSGGGMYCGGDGTQILGNLILGNDSAANGGGLVVRNADALVKDNVIANNVAGDHGGGLSLEFGEPVVVNNVIHDNQAGIDGGGVYCESTDAILTNDTIARNTAGSRGGGLAATADSWPKLRNTILWDDGAPSGVEIHTDGLIDVEACDVEGGWPGANNALNPLFTDAPNGDFHLMAGSPCIDDGDNLADELPDEDFEGDDRVQDGDVFPGAVVDMGADEYGN
jgi:parallel beta-helix repeat protein/predicted outer membrane repeat protein